MKTYNKNITSVALALISSIILTSSSAFSNESNIFIDLSVQRFLDNESELKREKYFNIHDNIIRSDYSASEVEFVQDILNVNHGRSFYSPLSLHGESPYPDTTTSIENGQINIKNTKEFRLFPYYSNRIVSTDHPKNVYQPHRDPVSGAKWAADYFEYYFDDETRPLFYEPMNEPFVHDRDYVEGPWNPEENKRHRDGMTLWFKEIGKEFDERNINVNVIGYSAAWPSLELWDFGHWDTYMKSFMDEAGEYMDAFSTHLYDGINVTGQSNLRSGSNASAILDLIETYSNIKWLYTKPHAITEYGNIVQRPSGEIHYDPAISAQALRSYNHMLFGFLERQDRILTSIPFISGKSRWYYQSNNFQPYGADMWRPDPDRIFGNKVNGFLLTEKVKFFNLWSEVRGNRVLIQSKDPDVRAHAFVQGNFSFLALNNLENEKKNVKLKFIGGHSTPITIRLKRLYVPHGEAAQYSDESLAKEIKSIALRPFETVVIQTQYEHAVTQNIASRVKTYYSSDYLKKITEDETLNFNFVNLDLNAGLRSYFYRHIIRGVEFNHKFFFSSCWKKNIKPGNYFKCLIHSTLYHWGYNDSQGYTTLRMSIGRNHDKSKQPLIFVNGHKMVVPNDWPGYDQANREQFFGAIEIPVPIKYLKPNTNINITFPDSGGRVSSVVLDVEKKEPLNLIAVQGITIPSQDFEMNKDLRRRIRASIVPENASDKFIYWTSSDPRIATVNERGIVTPVMPGTLTISAKTHDGSFIADTHVMINDQLSIADTVTITENFSDEIVSDTYSVQVTYTASVERDINLELRAPDSSWLGATTIAVPPGEGTAQLTLTFPEILPAGSGYRFTAGIRPTGGTWRDNFDAHAVGNVTISVE